MTTRSSNGKLHMRTRLRLFLFLSCSCLGCELYTQHERRVVGPIYPLDRQLDWAPQRGRTGNRRHTVKIPDGMVVSTSDPVVIGQSGANGSIAVNLNNSGQLRIFGSFTTHGDVVYTPAACKNLTAAVVIYRRVFFGSSMHRQRRRPPPHTTPSGRPLPMDAVDLLYDGHSD